MGIRDVAAQNKALANNYGASKGLNAPVSHTFHLFVGDPMIPEVDGGGVELAAGGGWAPPTIVNNGPNWPAPSGGRLTGVPLVLPTSTGAWAGAATHWALKGSDGVWWHTGRLKEVIDITAAGVTKTVTPVIYYGSRIA